MARFAERSSLNIGAPKVFKKERAQEEALPGYDDGAAAAPAPPPPPVATAADAALAAAQAAAGAAEVAALGARNLVAQLEREKVAAAEMGAPRVSAKAPPPAQWPPPVRRWVEKCFSLCTTSLERTKMQTSIKAVVEAAAEDGVFHTRDWDRHPPPSRATPRDSKRASTSAAATSAATTTTTTTAAADDDDDRRRRRHDDRDRDRDRDRRRDRDWERGGRDRDRDRRY